MTADEVGPPLTVLLTCEGTYPYQEGGVSTWCDVLIRSIPEARFTVLSLIAQPGAEPAYDLPPNVVELRPTPLWGTGAANELRRDLGWWELHRMRARLADPVAIAQFERAFGAFLRGVLLDDGTVDDVGDGLRRLAHFFRSYDYDATFRSEVAWSLFERHAQQFARERALSVVRRGTVDVKANEVFGRGKLVAAMAELSPPSALEVAEALRLLYRWLTPVGTPIPDVTLVHASATGLASIPGIVAKLERGTPFVLTEHGVYLRERMLAWAKDPRRSFLKQFAIRVMRRLVEASYAAADLIAPVSAWNVRWERQLGAHPDRIMPIANGVDPNRFSPQPFPPADPPTLVWVGRIDPLKDLITLVEAMAIVRKTLPNARIKLFGKAPRGNEGYDAHVRARVRALKLEHSVQFMGFASSPETAYAQGHAVVLSSISEGQPFSVIEAMLCGRPMIATGVGGVPEVIADCGLIARPRDPHGLAEACLAVLQSPDVYETLGAKARERALAHYTLGRFVESYRSVYQLATMWRDAALNPAR
ncbi:MAG: GT4 family glycosyltransferase PelF [Dehalococcoidia bacterium]|nr:GT4 family glycosyltransferase PelF [Dehalococcoidia bacterium]